MTDAPKTSDETTVPDSAGPDGGGPGVEDDHGAALERAAESIHEAQDAEGQVAAHEDITTLDAARAGEDSEDPGGEGGHP